MIFTALLLLLCQDSSSAHQGAGDFSLQPPRPGVVFSTYSLTFTQEPALALKSETEAEYRLAMHLIDVRGNYGNGAAQLLQLVDKPDVILIPGQASWMLAQAARALTLDGRTEDATLYIPGARNGSRGTEFEKPIDELLASFAPQSAGLDPEFLAHLQSSLRFPPDQGSFAKDYGRELLPYLKFIFKNEQGDIVLTIRQRALTLIFQVMDEESREWIRTELALQSTLARQGFMNHLVQNMLDFLDDEARRESAGALIEFSENAPDEMGTLSVDLLLQHIYLYDRTSDLPADPELAQRLSLTIVELFKSGKRSSTQDLWWVTRYSWNTQNPFFPLALQLANSSNDSVKEDVRWAIADKGQRDLLRNFVVDGTVEDQIRFCLQPSLFVDYFIKNGAGETLKEHREWGMAQLNLMATRDQLNNLPSRLNVDDEDTDMLISLVSSSDSFVRYLASTALQSIGRELEAANFLKDLGEDPTWARLFLQRWAQSNRSLSIEGMQALLPFAEDGPFQEEVHRLFESCGHDVLTVEMCRKWSLNPDMNVANSLWRRVEEEKSREDVLWIMLLDQPTNLNVEGAYYFAAKNSPRDFIAHVESWDAIRVKGKRSPKLEREAWKSLINLEGKTVLKEFETELDYFLFGVELDGRNHSDMGSIVEADPDLVIRLAHRHVENSQVMEWLSESNTLYNAIAGQRIHDWEALSQFAADLLRTDNYLFFDGGMPWLQTMVQPSKPSAEAYFAELWKKENLTNNLLEYRIRESIKTPSLRGRFRAELIVEMQNPEWTSLITYLYRDAGAVGEILDELLEVIEENDNATTLSSLIQAVGSIDDPRVVEILFAHLDDPREKVSNAASSALSRIQGIRAQKERWESWASGEDGEKLNPTQALIKNLKDPDLEIRLVSIESLGTLGEKEALPALINLLRDEDQQIKDAARKALDRINKNDDPTVKAQLTVRLTELEGELLSLQSRFTDEHPQVVGMKSKIKVVKDQLAALEKEQED
mgnify:CR=1 FL=1